MGKKKKAKRSKEQLHGPSAMDRKKNALVCSLAHYLQLPKNSIHIEDNGKVTVNIQEKETEPLLEVSQEDQLATATNKDVGGLNNQPLELVRSDNRENKITWMLITQIVNKFGGME